MDIPPKLLSCSRAFWMQPKVVVALPSLQRRGQLDWFQTRLDLDDLQLRKMVLTLPSLFNYSVEDNLAPKLALRGRSASRAALAWRTTSPRLGG